MGLALQAREVCLLISFWDVKQKPSEVPDRVAEDLVGKAIRALAPESGVMLLPKQHEVDCSRLPLILKNQGFRPRSWLHQMRRDDNDAGIFYHSIAISLIVEEESELTRPVFSWLEWILRQQAFKVRGYDNPFYLDEKPTGDRCVSINLDPLSYRRTPDRAKFRLMVVNGCLDYLRAGRPVAPT